LVMAVDPREIENFGVLFSGKRRYDAQE
jgi:hypothetical protein